MLKENNLVNFLANPFQLINHSFGLWVNKNNLDDFRIRSYEYDNSNKSLGLEDFYIHIPFPKYLLTSFTYQDALSLVFETGFYFKGYFVNSKRVNFKEILQKSSQKELNPEYAKLISERAKEFLETERKFMERQRLLFVKNYLSQL